MSVSLNPAATPAGSFSSLRDLVRDALENMGESTPDTALALSSGKYIRMANRVVDFINRHPYFLAIVQDGQFTSRVGSMTAGSAVLTCSTGSTDPKLFINGTPIVVAGAGYGNGDLYTTILETTDTSTFRLADTADTTVASVSVYSPYSGAIKRYTGLDDTRAIPDSVIIAGIEAYDSRKSLIDSRPNSVTVNEADFFAEVNAWLTNLLNLTFANKMDYSQTGNDF
ncbi:hypothetical protein EBT16_07840 [bacterium]|nr:hypothetical protein [bacterium]